MAVWNQLSREQQDALVERARQIIASSDKPPAWNALANQLGLNKATPIRRRLDPEWAKEKSRKENARRRDGRVKYTHLFRHPENYNGPGRASRDDIAARLAEIPPDDRDLTARVFGDPVPGRRAIDQRRGA